MPNTFRRVLLAAAAMAPMMGGYAYADGLISVIVTDPANPYWFTEGEVANWDRAQGYKKMQSLLQAHPDIIGVISGNDEMALGAVAALKEAGKLDKVKVGGFDGSPDAVAAIKAGELQYTVLQPVAVFSQKAVEQADKFIKTGKTGADTEKQLYDCILITKDNVDKMTSPFVFSE